MPILHLVRHAKASRDLPVDDRDRPLAPRGLRTAPAMAGWMVGNGVTPDLVLVSTARRCRETWAAMRPAFPEILAVEFEDGLYLAEAAVLLRRLRRLAPSRREVMVIGHNPGLQELAVMLAGEGEAEARRRLEAKFPTAALATLSGSGLAWAELGPKALRLERFVRPADILEV
jgi:phosphohistidine phosphatase